MGQPVHRFLEEFSDSAAAPQEMLAREWKPRVVVAGAAPESLTARLDLAYTRGREAGLAEGRSELSCEIERVRAEAVNELEKTKSMFAVEMADRLTSGLQRELEQLHDALADQLIAALTPVIQHVLTENSVRELVDEMRQLSRDNEAIRVELSGPQELVDRVWQAYCESVGADADRAAQHVLISYSATPEVRFVSNETLIETRLMEWIGKIMQATG